MSKQPMSPARSEETTSPLQKPLVTQTKRKYGLADADALVHSGTSVIRAKLDTEDKQDCASLACTAFGVWQPWMACMGCLLVDAAVAGRSLCKKQEEASVQDQAATAVSAVTTPLTTAATEKAKSCVDRTFFLLAITDVYRSIRADQSVSRHAAVRGGVVGGVAGTVANCIWGVKPFVDSSAQQATSPKSVSIMQ